MIDASGKAVGNECYNAEYQVYNPKTSVSYNSSKCKNAIPSNYILRTTFNRQNPLPTINQTVDSAVTFTKVAPNITAKYHASNVKYKKDVVINLGYTPNVQFFNSNAYAKGSFKIVNLNTKKTIETFSWDTFTSGIQKKITLKGVKKGTYKLAVVFTADAKQGIF